MTQTNDALASAIAALGAVEVRSPRSVACDSPSLAALADEVAALYAYPDGYEWRVTNAAAILNIQAAQPYVHTLEALRELSWPMPAWWSPERRYAAKCITPGDERILHTYRTVPPLVLCDPHEAIAVTASLETGEEIPA